MTATAGLCLWIILWSLRVSGFDGMLIVLALVVLTIGIRNLLPFLPGRLPACRWLSGSGSGRRSRPGPPRVRAPTG